MVSSRILLKYLGVKMNKPIIIYNLFPRIVGNIEDWYSHLERINKMGFNCIYINPIHFPGFSGSLYAVKDYYKYNPLFFKSDDIKENEDKLKRFIDECHKKNISVIIDLVINHTAIDSPLIEEHKDWYRYNDDGSIFHPGAYKNGKKIVEWGDLAEIANADSKDKANLWKYWEELVIHLIKLGFDGFRADAAYQVPANLWKKLIKAARKIKKDAIFMAETLGCTPEESEITAKAGFDFIFNSSKYWDFKEPWCPTQYNRYRKFTSTISFPESHDTDRLFKDLNGNQAEMEKLYLFSALFSSGVMIPIGFEFGFKNRLNVSNTSPFNWEEENINIVDYISRVNELKANNPVFHEDDEIVDIKNVDDRIYAFMKKSKSQWAMIIINKDPDNYGHFSINNLFGIMSAETIIDCSPNFGKERVPNNYDYYLRPSQVKVLIANKR